MSAAALLRLRGLPATRNCGWGWLRVGRHWKVKTSGSLCEVSPGHQFGDSPKPQVIDGLQVIDGPGATRARSTVSVPSIGGWPGQTRREKKQTLTPRVDCGAGMRRSPPRHVPIDLAALHHEYHPLQR